MSVCLSSWLDKAHDNSLVYSNIFSKSSSKMGYVKPLLFKLNTDLSQLNF